jgi:hypothetical protein
MKIEIEEFFGAAKDSLLANLERRSEGVKLRRKIYS